MAQHHATLATWAPALLAALDPEAAQRAHSYEEHLWALCSTLLRLRTPAAPPISAACEDVMRQALAALQPSGQAGEGSAGELVVQLQGYVNAALFPK